MSDEFSTLIGILLDVSGSMKSNFGGEVQMQRESWIRSVFTVIHDLIKHDLSDSNQMFAIGVGASCETVIFDVIGTLDKIEKRASLPFSTIIERILQISEQNGAHSVRKWASHEVIENVVSYEKASSILNQLESDRSFVNFFVNECLPAACKGVTPSAFRGDCNFLFKTIGNMMETVESSVASIRPATVEDIEEVVRKVNHRLPQIVKKGSEMLLQRVNAASSCFNVKKASRIICGCVEENKLTENRIQELVGAVEPFIYGGTPMFSALNTALTIFQHARLCVYKKLLFILSDGEPTDGGRLEELTSSLQNQHVHVVCCFITSCSEIQPKRLFSFPGQDWGEGAKFLFDLSSKVPTQLLPRTIFIKRHWDIEIDNNETRLFLQVNHPDHIRDACDLARNVVCCQDALADMLTSVSLDLYINQCTGDFPARLQQEDTCYANASATVLHLSMKRILGRKGGYPDFYALRRDLIRHFGKDGANTFNVLQTICPFYRLHCEKKDIKGALCAVSAKRPVVATFRLTKTEWRAFRNFFRKNKTGIISRTDIDISKPKGYEQLEGHAVVLVSFNSQCLRFMNSWGEQWGDQGFFRVQKADLLRFTFVDVFWKTDDLYQKEKDYYAKHGSEVAEKIMINLKGLQTAKYKCPLCRELSLVTDFSGNLLNAKCPNCQGDFQCNGADNILALNIYLTSLSN